MTDYVGTILGYRTDSSAFGSNVTRSLNGSYNYQSYGTYNRAPSNATMNRIANNWASAYCSNINTINRYMQQGNIDEALKEYDALFNKAEINAKLYNYDFDDSQIASAINLAYQKLTGTTFVDNVEGNTSSPFVTGLRNGIPIIGTFFTQHDSNADTLAKLSGKKTPTKAVLGECAGGFLSGAASGAAIGAILGGGFPGAVIGGAIGAALGIFTGLGLLDFN